MSPNDVSPDPDVLVRYLLGSLSKDETERFDELSVTDDEFAARLRSAEDDLIDAYVRGELAGETLERFTSAYLSQPAGIRRIAFADALQKYQARHADPPGAVVQRPSSTSMPAWSLAAAAVLVLAAAGYFFVENVRLRTDIAAERDALRTRERELLGALSDQQARNAETAKELEAARDTLAQAGKSAAAPRPGVLSFVLVAPTRGAGDIARLVLPPGIDDVLLQVQLEATEFPAYQAALRDPATNRVVWRSSRLDAPAPAARGFLRVTIPVRVLNSRHYVLDLMAFPARGEGVVVANYAFAVVVK
jgi:hypothetical protein